MHYKWLKILFLIGLGLLMMETAGDCSMKPTATRGLFPPLSAWLYIGTSVEEIRFVLTIFEGSKTFC